MKMFIFNQEAVAHAEASENGLNVLKANETMAFKDGRIVVGGHFGDEGKGKIIDIYCSEYKEQGVKILSIRGQGSGNAGHTVVVNGEKLDFHYLTSAGLSADIMLLAAGVLIDPIRVLEEAKKLPEDKRNIILIDERATICTDLDRAMDAWIENQRSNVGRTLIGTTKSGVGPCAAVKAQRDHVTFADAIACDNPDELRSLFVSRPGTPSEVLEVMTDDYANELFNAIHELKIVNSQKVITQCKMEGYAVLLEVSQAICLDPNYGNGGHFCTSTPTTNVGAVAGAGLTFSDFPGGTTMVLKAYSSKVGGGPFITKFTAEEKAIADIIYRVNGERGVTTGRVRDLGWFDAPAIRASIMRTGCREIVVNCMDIIPMLQQATDYIYVCDYYIDKKTGERMYDWPYDLTKYEPHYDRMSIKGMSEHEIISNYTLFLSQHINQKIDYIGVGPSRDDILKVSWDNIF